ncbi:hypothetical protein H4R19_001911, partial [Coemansia spiralis]
MQDDELFYVDTGGSASVSTTMASSREFRAVEVRTVARPPAAGSQRGIRVLDDDIGVQSSGSGGPR